MKKNLKNIILVIGICLAIGLLLSCAASGSSEAQKIEKSNTEVFDLKTNNLNPLNT